MRRNNIIVETANKIYAIVTDGLETLAKENANLVASIPNDDPETAFEKVDTLVRCVSAVMRGASVDGVGLPDFLTSITTAEGALTSADITVKSKLKAKNRIKVTRTIEIDDDFIENLGKLFIDTLYEMYYMACADENVVALNEKIATILEEEGIKFGLEFAVTTDKSRVVYIDNTKVVIKAQLDKALEIASLGIMKDVKEEADEYDKMVAGEARAEFVSIMRTIQITPEILKKKIKLVEELGDLHTKKHSNKLIREGYHKKAENLKDAKSGVGYFSEKVEINGESVDVFALVQKNEAGAYEVVLNPFDVNSNVAVDFDVVGAVSK